MTRESERLDDHLGRLDLAEAGDRGVRVEDGRLVVPGIDADERPPEVQAAHDELSRRPSRPTAGGYAPAPVNPSRRHLM